MTTVPICVKNEENEIDTNNIWKDDLFDRKEVADNYTKIIKSIEQPYVLSINARYGSGKTFFLKRWREQLRKDNEHIIFFNAWECDFVEKPLLPFLYNLLVQLKEQKLITYDFSKDLSNCQDIIILALKKIISFTSNGIVDIEEFNKNKNADSIQLPKISVLEEYKQLQATICEFKEGLDKIVKNLGGKNLYIFIDELERCRPTFAIELLEAVKHLFNVKGIVFVLGIDRTQLKHTISNIYGCGMDGEGYLRRFIDLELELPPVDLKIFTNYLKDKFEIKNKTKELSNNWLVGYDDFNTYFDIFSKLYDFQLRDIEQIYYKFNVITKMIDESELKIIPLLTLLMILKMKDFELYQDFNLQNLKSENIQKFLNEKIINRIINNENKRRLNHFFKICLALQPCPKDIDSTKFDNFNIDIFEIYELENILSSNYSDLIQYLKNMISCISIK